LTAPLNTPLGEKVNGSEGGRRKEGGKRSIMGTKNRHAVVGLLPGKKEGFNSWVQ